MKRRDWSWIIALIILYGCPKTVTTQHDDKIDTNVSNDRHEETFKDIDKDVDTTVDKKQAPTEITQHLSDELFGWAPPPPGALDQKPQWVVLQRKTNDTTKKIGAIDTSKKTEAKEVAKEGAKLDDKSTGKTVATSKGDETIETPGFLQMILGKHWRLILLAVGGVISFGALAYINPTWLGIPARIFKWGLAKLRERLGKKTDVN